VKNNPVGNDGRMHDHSSWGFAEEKYTNPMRASVIFSHSQIMKYVHERLQSTSPANRGVRNTTIIHGQHDGSSTSSSNSNEESIHVTKSLEIPQ
jgi:hypothetical protein